MKRLFAAFAAVAVLMVAMPAVAGVVYLGGWQYDDNPGGREYMVLGDNTEGTGLLLRGTAAWCGQRGDPYAKVRNVLSRNYGNQIEWWITDVCDSGYVRVCVSNLRNETACSSYLNGGWHDF